mgnify:CR=1 FL=1
MILRRFGAVTLFIYRLSAQLLDSRHEDRRVPRRGFHHRRRLRGLVSPDYGTMARRAYFAAPLTLYTAAALRMVMGLVVILAASAARAPKNLRVLGGLMLFQGLTATVLRP